LQYAYYNIVCKEVALKWGMTSKKVGESGGEASINPLHPRESRLPEKLPQPAEKGGNRIRNSFFRRPLTGGVVVDRLLSMNNMQIGTWS
jgi:hypothetical protein